MLDSINIIQTAGLIGIFLIIFAESGLFFAFFLPGDSLFFAAGLFAHGGFLPLWPLIFGSIISAILGGFAGYLTGRKLGPKVFTKESSVFFSKRYLVKSEEYYDKYGKMTVIIARFIPIVRTFAPILAGVGKMNFKTFAFLNIVSGIIWPMIVISIGYFIGSRIPNVESYFLPISILIIFLSIIPLVWRVVKIWWYSRHQ
jgi:membrane-associated protein